MPYAVPAALVTLLLMAWCCSVARGAELRGFLRASWIVVGLVTGALVPPLPQASWLRAWPSNAAVVVAGAIWPSQPLPATQRVALVDPPDPHATWHAHATSTAKRQTFVVVVGENVRAEHLARGAFYRGDTDPPAAS